MIETITTPTAPHPQAATAPDHAVYTSDILMNVIVAFLAPMFLYASDGDVYFARMAAIETVKAYRASSHADLIAVAQIIAYGLAALGSLSLSLDDDISLNMTLRLRGNAVALNRSAEQNRRAIKEARGANDPAFMGSHEQPPEQPIAAERKPAAIYSPAASHPTEDSVAFLPNPDPAPVPAPSPTPPNTPAPMATEPKPEALWAAAMNEMAAEYIASLPNLSPEDRRLASVRAAALSSTAGCLMSNQSLPAEVPTQR